MNQENYSEQVELTALAPSRFGYYSALVTVILTIVSFGFALYAIPISGANCLGNCAEYPYLDTIERFPRDFMYRQKRGAWPPNSASSTPTMQPQSADGLALRAAHEGTVT